MGELTKLPNIAKTMEAQLLAVGVETPEQLAKAGSRETWLKIKAMDPSACYTRLCALEGAIRGVRWHSLPEDVKADLKRFYQEHRHPRLTKGNPPVSG